MSKRDYEAFAKLIHDMPGWFDGATRVEDFTERLAVEIAELLEQQTGGRNKFDRARFLAACLEGGA